MSRRWGPPPQSRPQWWPEGRSWPPQRGWRRGGRYGPPPFVWRFGCLALLLLWVFSGIVSAAVYAVSGHFGPLPAVTFVIVVLLVVSAVVGSGMRRFARPMDDLIDAAGRVERGDYSASIAEHGPPQVRSVARAFNSMSARLKAADEQRRGLLAEVVHELRTPLAVIQAQAEAIADGVYPADAEHLAPILDATRSLEVLVEDLRALALTDTGSLVLNREPVDPAELVRDTVATFEAKADAAGVSLVDKVAEGLPPADVDPVRMRSALGNVVANGIRYTPRGGSITVYAERAGDRIALSVSDTGQGIAPDMLPRVFDRFARGLESTGSGLGLAIAHDIVAAHGGRIEVVSSTPSGTTVRMTVPIASGE
jgi:two-component system sensor histidine kinase BaeS